MIARMMNQKTSPTSTVGAREKAAFAQKFSSTAPAYVTGLLQNRDDGNHDEDSQQRGRHEHARRAPGHDPLFTMPTMPVSRVYRPTPVTMIQMATRANDVSFFFFSSPGSLRSVMTEEFTLIA
jgi:hypothetical protein